MINEKGQGKQERIWNEEEDLEVKKQEKRKEDNYEKGKRRQTGKTRKFGYKNEKERRKTR